MSIKDLLLFFVDFIKFAFFKIIDPIKDSWSSYLDFDGFIWFCGLVLLLVLEALFILWLCKVTGSSPLTIIMMAS